MATNVITKLCPDCSKTLPSEAFGANPNGRYGLNTYCRPCVAARTRAWKQKNYESVIAHKRAYYEANKARLLEQQRQYYRENKTRILEAQRRQPEENRAHVKAWAKANPEKRRAQGRRRVQNLAANYVRQCITGRSEISSDAIPPELIDLKRDQLAIKRMARELKKAATQQDGATQ